jgi:glucan phosphoethanolaminetransferase (alkaline phosphatase superfamily)
MAVRHIEVSGWLVVAADLAALCAFVVSVAVAAHDGVNSGALLVGVPPLIIAMLASLAHAASIRWVARWPLVLTIIVCGLAMLATMVSFITPLLVVTAPVAGLLIAASAIRLETV